MDVFNDQRIVMTLDAGGTNFIFSALQAGSEIIEPVKRPAISDDREKSLKTIINGFQDVKSQLEQSPVAISFAFPGPADYRAGIIDNVGNLPAFSGGVALGPMLEEQFNLPVFINNDGDLFAYGEAMAGLLLEINQTLQKKNVPKQYKNLFGATVGTGFGGGIIINNRLAQGDNSASGEVWLSRNYDETNLIAEEGVSIRAVQHTYRKNNPDTSDLLSPKDIYDIALGKKQGNKQAAIKAFKKMGAVLGESLANAVTLIDGIIVIGGGISGAADLFLPAVVNQLNSTICSREGKEFPRLVSKVYSLEDPSSEEEFYHFESREVAVPFSDKQVPYVPEKRLAVGISRLGTSQATALGAYAFALHNL